VDATQVKLRSLTKFYFTQQLHRSLIKIELRKDIT